MSDEAKRFQSGNFTLTLNLTQTRGISMQGFVYSDDTRADVDARVDMMQDVLDRQAVRCDVTSKEAQIAAHVQNLELMREQMEDLVAQKNAGKKLATTQKQALDNYEPSVRRAKEMIDGLRAAIKAAKAKYGFE